MAILYHITCMQPRINQWQCRKLYFQFIVVRLQQIFTSKFTSNVSVWRLCKVILFYGRIVNFSQMWMRPMLLLKEIELLIALVMNSHNWILYLVYWLRMAKTDFSLLIRQISNLQIFFVTSQARIIEASVLTENLLPYIFLLRHSRSWICHFLLV